LPPGSLSAGGPDDYEMGMGYLRQETGGVAVKSTRRNGAVKPLGFKPCGGT